MRLTKLTALLLFVVVSFGAGPAPATQPRREAVEWLDVWVPTATEAEKDLPRVLLIGDSITRAYYPEVVKRLAGKAVVARLCTSRCVCDPQFFREVTIVLMDGHYDVIHFNNGMHGWDYSEGEYGAALPVLWDELHKLAAGAKVVWATTTPVRERGHIEAVDEAKTARVKLRNRLAGEFFGMHGVACDDLFSLVEGHAEYWKADGVHFDAAGTAAEAGQVAGAVEKAIGG